MLDDDGLRNERGRIMLLQKYKKMTKMSKIVFFLLKTAKKSAILRLAKKIILFEIYIKTFVFYIFSLSE